MNIRLLVAAACAALTACVSTYKAPPTPADQMAMVYPDLSGGSFGLVTIVSIDGQAASSIPSIGFRDHPGSRHGFAIPAGPHVIRMKLSSVDGTWLRAGEADHKFTAEAGKSYVVRAEITSNHQFQTWVDELVDRSFATVPAATTTDAPATGRSADIAHLRELLSRGPRDGSEACKDIPFSGLTDVAFFDALEKSVKQANIDAGTHPDFLNKAAYCVRALASSGNPKYHETIAALATTDGSRIGDYVARNATTALQMLDQFAQWNAVIDRERPDLAALPGAGVRAVNMMESDVPELQRAGIDAVRKLQGEVPALDDSVAARLMELYPTVHDDPKREDNLAHFCKALGESRNPKYRAMLAEIAEKAPSSKVRHYASDVAGDLPQSAAHN